MPSLPKIMVAPNGATRTKADHPQLPMSDDEVFETALACHKAGADGLHFHLRDAQGRHVLDAPRCRKMLERLSAAAPELVVQVTSEAAGIYTADAQIAFIKDLMPPFVSIGLREIMRLDNAAEFQKFYHALAEQRIWVQHILYSHEDFLQLQDLHDQGVIPDITSVLFVCGRYSAGQNSTADDLTPFLTAMPQSAPPDWAVCAFGAGETTVLAHALNMGGKVRVGFENSLWHEDGRLAIDNADRVQHIVASQDC